MRVLIGCEFSGTVRDAFLRLGHDAMSCDLLPTDSPGPHYQGDVMDVINDGWDLMIAHPPCTDLAVSGARHFAAKIADGRQQKALDFVGALFKAKIKKKVIENPISIISSRFRKPDQIIQPHQFGHPEFKATCLWLEGLPLLQPQNAIVPPPKYDERWEGFSVIKLLNTKWRDWNKVHRMAPGPDRWKKRSTTYLGIAKAFAEQYGGRV